MPLSIPYFGVAGVTDVSQARYLRDAHQLRHPGYATAVGVLASLTTLEGTEAARSPRFPARYPKRELWSAIFSEAGPSTVRMLHYDGPSDETFPAQLAGAMRWAGPLCSGVQLNIAWPNAKEVRAFRVSYPDIAVVLQLSAKALRMARDHVPTVIELVYAYGSDIDYVLLDPSGGSGTALTEELAVRYLDALSEHFGGTLGLVVAGGFGPFSTDLALKLIDKYPGLSVDAEGKLRDGSDRLDRRRAIDYLIELHREHETSR